MFGVMQGEVWDPVRSEFLQNSPTANITRDFFRIKG